MLLSIERKYKQVLDSLLQNNFTNLSQIFEKQKKQLRYILRYKQQSKNIEALPPHAKSNIQLNLLFVRYPGDLKLLKILLSDLSLFPYFLRNILCHTRKQNLHLTQKEGDLQISKIGNHNSFEVFQGVKGKRKKIRQKSLRIKV